MRRLRRARLPLLQHHLDAIGVGGIRRAHREAGGCIGYRNVVAPDRAGGGGDGVAGGGGLGHEDSDRFVNNLHRVALPELQSAEVHSLAANETIVDLSQNQSGLF